eukprot:TRINITY_DN16439_c0_g1_i2.p1 TRINITY_DN16439_c0_g1~~TRINITY_DN16439_c0_g1_i2.p1  ORF type:complete len:169 (-),score=17.31 TRINITY_DN16439_c0_g1_i2:44-550(-)
MLRSLVGSEMCIRDRYQRRVRDSEVLHMLRRAAGTSLDHPTNTADVAPDLGCVRCALCVFEGAPGQRTVPHTRKGTWNCCSGPCSDTRTSPIPCRVLAGAAGRRPPARDRHVPAPAPRCSVDGVACPGSPVPTEPPTCLLYTSDAADEEDSVDLGGRRIIKKKKEKNH